MPTLALVDGHSIAYRAFYALPEDLATTSGQVTNAVFGFTRMLIKLLGDHHPDGLAVAWDVGRQTFRTEWYPEYKAQRSAAPDTFKTQLPLMREVLDALGIRQIQLEGYEADDVIASLSEQAVSDGWDVLIVTGDRDSFQLIDDHRRVLYTRRGITDTVVADDAYVQGRYGIDPEAYVERAAMCGDTSDNLPGVNGVGDKTAAKLLVQYGSLEGIFEHLDEATPKLRQNLAEAREQVFLNRRMMRLVRDLDLGVQPADLVRGEWDRSVARELFASLEFHSLWDDLVAVQPGADGSGPGEVIEASGRIVSSPDAVAALAALDRFVVDLVEGGDMGAIAILETETEAAVVPFDALGPLAAALADPGRPKVAHDAKPLMRRLLAAGFELRGLSFDTALAAYLVDPAARSYDLGTIAERLAGIELSSPDKEGTAGRGGQGAFDFTEGPDLETSARRVAVIARIESALTSELGNRAELDLYREFELPLVAVLARMEDVGIGVDRPYLEGLAADMRSELEVLEREIHERAGEPFNVNSPDQLATILFSRMGLPVLKKTPGGKPSTDASVLEKLVEHDESGMLDRLLRYREVEKLRSTYVDGYLPLIGPDGRIHTRFNQMAATTGRLSSEEPNLQNIPVRSESGRTIRQAFVAGDGAIFVVADYSQIELRVLAHMSGDAGLLEAFESGLDVHTATAARVFAVPADLVTSEMRRMAKVINFGLLYGMEAFGLASRLGVSRDEAKAHIEAYYSQFPDVRAYMEGVVVEARRNGYTSTLFGRRRYLPELKSDNFRIRQMGERMALNAPIQGTAADVIKKAMIGMDPALESTGAGARMLLQIHDELVVETPVEAVDQTIELTRRVMEGAVDMKVPLVVDVAVGDTLAATKPS
jgi:DNA polymerase-1